MSQDPLDLDAHLEELLTIRERLADTEDLAERQSLIARQRELRSQSRSEPLEHVSLDQLHALEASLLAKRESLIGRRLNIGAAGMGGPWNEGLDPIQTMEHNRRVDAASGLSDLETRLAEARAEIARRE